MNKSLLSPVQLSPFTGTKAFSDSSHIKNLKKLLVGMVSFTHWVKPVGKNWVKRSVYLSVKLGLSLSFNGHFPSEPGLAGVY